MWKIYEAKDVTKGLKKMPKQVQQKYKAWVEVVKNGGARNLRNFPGFRDEKLKGDLRECRSSRLNIQYRVVYTENKKVKEVYVLKITPHKYEEV
ncbi:MAG: type II toxin-antitoxin system mRNA interferase toxin, RelE/StbE family [Halobacteriovoraceae bacterium]|nr:type II toxin-antitoxin system mRNA interferase toxin, RelE/StbE family [Halobacteriovoraceae bacterium]MCB9095372.1 type II toxin-antitoxin system mRNA interferase toxin, RelE/StbE family [Halobacteriovoraceae bacterium]